MKEKGRGIEEGGSKRNGGNRKKVKEDVETDLDRKRNGSQKGRIRFKGKIKGH